MNKSEYYQNLKYYGKEPEYKNKLLTSLEIIKSLNWYNYMSNINDSREYLKEYLLKTNDKRLSEIDKISDNDFILSTGWISKILLNSNSIPLEYLDSFHNKIDLMINKTYKKMNNKNTKPYSIVYDLTGDIEELFDKNQLEKLDEFLNKNNITKTNLKIIEYYYKECLNELLALDNTEDEQLIEGYSKYSKNEIMSLKNKYNFILNELNNFNNDVKINITSDLSNNSIKKPKNIRKPRKIDPKKVVKHLKYLESVKINNVEYFSIKPEKILDSTEIWTYNIQSSVLTVLRAEFNKKLSVKGTSIVNIDNENSFSKRIGRVANDLLPVIKQNNKSFIKNEFGKVKSTVKEGNIRCSKQTIILRNF